jgi:hypothetical protein
VGVKVAGDVETGCASSSAEAEGWTRPPFQFYFSSTEESSYEPPAASMTDQVPGADACNYHYQHLPPPCSPAATQVTAGSIDTSLPAGGGQEVPVPDLISFSRSGTPKPVQLPANDGACSSCPVEATELQLQRATSAHLNTAQEAPSQADRELLQLQIDMIAAGMGVLQSEGQAGGRGADGGGPMPMDVD